MADVPERERLTGFDSLPLEIRHHIFNYIYPPWHFEYTQVHDRLPTHGPKDTISAANDIAVDLTSTPRFSNLPSIAPLLVCKDFHNAGRHIFDSSFTGHIHVISGMIWKEVHWTYACIMAKATTLTINVGYLDSLQRCRILDRLPNLKNVIVVETRPDNFHLPYRHENFEAEPHRAPDQLPLEGSEFMSFLPTHFDLSDNGLQKYWNDTIGVNESWGLHTFICRILFSLQVTIICRVVMKVPVLPEYLNQGIVVFMMLDFQLELQKGWTGSIDERTGSCVVRKRLAMLKQEVS